MMVMYMHRMNHECLQNSMTIHSVWVVLMINTKTSFTDCICKLFYINGLHFKR